MFPRDFSALPIRRRRAIKAHSVRFDREFFCSAYQRRHRMELKRRTVNAMRNYLQSIGEK
jgi:hypothetical protein